MVKYRSVLFSIVVLAKLASLAALAEKPTYNQIIGTNGEPIGFTEQELITRSDGASERRYHRELLLREQDSPSRRVVETTRINVDPLGYTTSITRDYSAGRTTSKIVAQIDGHRAKITRIIRGDQQHVSLTLPDDLVFDNGAELLSNWDFALPVNLRFHALDINGPAINEITLTELVPHTQSEGRTIVRRVNRVEPTGKPFHGVSRLYLNSAGELLELTQASFGGSFKVEPIDSTTSAGQKPLKATSLVSQVLVKSPVRIPLAARKSRIRITFDPMDDNVVLPQTGEQRTDEGAAGKIVVDVCEGCGPGLPSDNAYLAAAREPGFWVQSDHPLIQKRAFRVGRLKLSDARKMARLTELASQSIRKLDFTGHVSAVETLRRRTGDCTEAAVLLAAFGRAIGIPTRVASGIVYSRERYHGMSHTFMPHAWVLAYVDDRWQSFDSALNEFDSTHIAFTISDGDPGAIAAGHRLAGLLRIDSISEVRQKP